MLVAQHQTVVQALRSDGPDPSFSNGICLGRPDGRPNLRDSECSHSSIEGSAIATIPVTNQIVRGVPIRIASVCHLLCEPFSRGIRSHTGVDDLPRTVVDYKEDVERTKPDRMDGEEIAGPDLLGVLSQELPPARRRLAVPSLSHVLGHRSGTDGETEGSELTLDALLPPERILPRHTADQLPELDRNTRPPASPPLL